MRNSSLIIFLITVSLLLMNLVVGCNKSGGKVDSEQLHNLLLEKIKSEGGKVLADCKGTNELGTIIYTNEKGLYQLNPEQRKAKLIFPNPSSLKITSFSLAPENGIYQISVRENPMTKSRDIITGGNANELYRVEWPWIFIGDTYISNINDSTKIIDISNFYDERRGNTKVNDVGNKEYKGSFSIDSDKKLTISVFDRQTNLPGFYEYNPQSIPQSLWNGKMWLKEFYRAYIGELGDLYDKEVGSELDYEYKKGENYCMKLSFDQEGKFITDSSVYWNGNIINKDDLSTSGMKPYYKKRELAISSDLNKTKEYLYEKLSKVDAEYEKIRQKDLENQIQDIKNQAVALRDIVQSYCSNEMKAKKDYPFNQKMVIKASLEEINRSSSNFNYVLRPSDDDPLCNIYIFTNDEQFTDFSYPIYVYMYVLFEGVSANTDWFSEMTTYKFIFSDAKALLWIKD